MDLHPNGVHRSKKYAAMSFWPPQIVNGLVIFGWFLTKNFTQILWAVGCPQSLFALSYRPPVRLDHGRTNPGHRHPLGVVLSGDAPPNQGDSRLERRGFHDIPWVPWVPYPRFESSPAGICARISMYSGWLMLPHWRAMTAGGSRSQCLWHISEGHWQSLVY